MSASSPSLCLNLIVKNEGAIIDRCLTNVADIVTDYAVLDTGSNDDTLAKLLGFTLLPGVVDTLPFENFAQARNASLNLATRVTKASHLLLIDADMVLVVTNKALLFEILASHPNSIFLMTQCHGNLEYVNVRIVPTRSGARYVGVTHEYLHSELPKVVIPRTACYINDVSDGGCKQDKFERDIRLLSVAFSDESQVADRPRYCFYLAQSYRDSGNTVKAAELYAMRAAMQGTWVQEICASLLALLLMEIGPSVAVTVSDPLTPHLSSRMVTNEVELRALSLLGRMEATGVARPEGYHAMCSYYSKLGRRADAMKFLTLAYQSVPLPESGVELPLFYDTSISEYMLSYEASILFWYMGQGTWWRMRGKQLCEELLVSPRVPAYVRSIVSFNYESFYKML
jgi:hypothetical protein